MNFWLMKSEPNAYSWDTLVKEGWTHWDGVRNYQARNNMKAMQVGDMALFYHSVSDKQVVGIAKVTKTAYPDHTFTPKEGKKSPWEMVDIKPVKPFTKFVTLAEIKAEPSLENLALVKQSRLSVVPVSKGEFDKICQMGNTSI